MYKLLLILGTISPALFAAHPKMPAPPTGKTAATHAACTNPVVLHQVGVNEGGRGNPGLITLSAVIDLSGLPTQIRVVDEQPHAYRYRAGWRNIGGWRYRTVPVPPYLAGYAAAAMRALAQWRFQPAICDGKATPETATVRFDFHHYSDVSKWAGTPFYRRAITAASNR